MELVARRASAGLCLLRRATDRIVTSRARDGMVIIRPSQCVRNGLAIKYIANTAGLH